MFEVQITFKIHFQKKKTVVNAFDKDGNYIFLGTLELFLNNLFNLIKKMYELQNPR